ncbi:MAG: hypothetical protein IJ368_00890, partial [Oscillospiraceae bacterium]|nr:hypothetical protein [Oscillospiraceae bacterium]
EVMPEDANPKLDKSSMQNYLYFTLPMALNYQRNSYSLWQSALKTYNDKETSFIFSPKECLTHSFEEIRQAITKYKVALQKQKQTEIWIRLCETFERRFGGDVRRLFDENNNDIQQIKHYIQNEHKKEYPYLSGEKICNYWLYVICQYTDRRFQNINELTVAPDTHVCKASLKLGVITEEEYNSANVQEIVIKAWKKLFENTEYNPIDIHTPLWLWSRGGFADIGFE